MRSLTLGLFCLGLLLASSTGCREESSLFANQKTGTGYDEEEVKAEIDSLVVGEEMAGSIEADIEFWDTVDALIDRSSLIQPTLIEELSSSRSWAVRLGVLHVLASIGTKECVEPVLACLRDDHPVVARQALSLLRELTGHQIVQEDPAPGDLPALPDDMEAWRTWHRQHQARLHLRWTQWWEANRDQTTID